MATDKKRQKRLELGLAAIEGVIDSLNSDLDAKDIATCLAAQLTVHCYRNQLFLMSFVESSVRTLFGALADIEPLQTKDKPS